MKEFLKNRAGSVVVMVIIVIIVSVVGGGATFLGVRMLVSGDGNFFQPFEDLGWIEPKDEEEEEKEKSESKAETKDYESKYKVDESKLSFVAKESDTEHYYAEISLTEMMGENTDSYDEYSEMYDKLKMIMNVYVRDDMVVEIAIGFNISDFCDYAYDLLKENDGLDYFGESISSSDDLKEYMITYIEQMYNSEMEDEEASEYLKFVSDVDKGTIEIYMTEDAINEAFENYGTDPEERSFDSFVEAMNDSDMNIDFKLVD